MSNAQRRRSNLGSVHSRQSVRQSVLVTTDDAYSYALRCAYLHYLLQPRPRRQIPAPAAPAIHRTSTSFHEVMRDFSHSMRDAKSTRFPKDFMPNLQKRLESVWMGRDNHVEYKDPAVKRTFAAFYTAFKEPRFYDQVSKSRRAEDLVLIFYSSATKELQKLKADDSWKWLADRHVALFVRLMHAVIKELGGHQELSSKLGTMESKLLQHDSNLSDETNRRSSTSTILGPPAPLSYNVNDMPMVKVVAKVFNIPLATCQQDINMNKAAWTEKAALQDLKTYNNFLSLGNTRRTLRSDDFDTDEAWETWRKSEGPALSQLMLAIVQSNPTELSKTTSGQPSSGMRNSIPSSVSYSIPGDLARPSSISSFDQPVDMEALGLSPSSPTDSTLDTPYTYIPPDPRSYYRAVAERCFTYDINDPDLQPIELPGSEDPVSLISKSSLELLAECGLRWRVPLSSRIILFMDVIRSKYQDSEIDLSILDTAFTYAKNATSFEWPTWTLSDQNMFRQILSAVHDTLLRELYDILQHAFDAKARPVASVMWILDQHIYDDPLFTPGDMDSYVDQLKEGLKIRAGEVMEELMRDLPQDRSELDPFHVVELTQKVVKLAEKISKRFKQPVLGSVNPVMIFIEIVFPKFAVEAKSIILDIMNIYKEKNQEVEIEDGFDLYKELAEIRRIYSEAHPEKRFPVHFEDFLADFVWRWLKNTDSKVIGWVDEAIKHDDFTIKIREEEGREPTDDERHTLSVLDIFRSFNQTVDYIKKLEWGDDIQHARFMTALSKTIGSGIARYCEVLEKLFTFEMDRQTPEQEAAANQTRQQKWMALARDAWSNTEKIEPFQFAPESCVKLNDIEFAILQLDKLEHSVNVDGVAEALVRAAPPPGRKPLKNYVFTIKIVEAEDLKAMDINGFSDPYVVLGDEYQKRLAKTRVVYRNLNPRWEETVDITTQGSIWLTATVWDWDTVGDHDCVGRTSIKLDPAHFGDFMPQEHWLELDTQGRLLLRVSMEGERDDIQFYFGKAFRTLKRTERDMTRQITDKLSAYIHHCLSRAALKNVLSKGYGISAVSSLFSRTGLGARPQSTVGPAVSEADIAAAVVPLTDYFNENFAILNTTLTSSAMMLVMSRLWKEILVTLEALLVPTLSDQPSQQKPLTPQESEVCFRWLQLMFDFFHVIDENTGEASGVPLEILKSPKYHELQSLNFFYFESTDNLIRTSERMANAAAARQQQARARMSNSHTSNQVGGMLGVPGAKRTKSVLMSRNLGTMRKAKEEKRREAQAEPSDDMILRILRMRPEAAGYLKDRSRQKERLAATAAAEAIVRQSMSAGPGRMGAMVPGMRR
ncbi:uncharacterized protein LAJ45_05722 [Morchella importuna]|uniref:C2 domain-containing protein n=1 Tax=Morchella conica CCBAS932 TaxID=1392247 RepID=A0A3N4KQV1_9PEZI|nr:uncharacterized protein LAJ45_05722 [Morchella importuna]KAH8150036.1 hypothetical protein LAJ45_05722 [Morchella importuna]RPB08145.1 hypothetical protein P167DRAFT_608900 [Morchella conica CCBAS932]